MREGRRAWATVLDASGHPVGQVRCAVHRSSYEEIEEDGEAFSGETALAVFTPGREAVRRGMLLETAGGTRYEVLNVSPGIGRTWTAKLRRFVFQGEA